MSSQGAVAVHRDVLDDGQPWTWRLDDVMGLLTDRQRRYVELLPQVFRVVSAHGDALDYEMQPYQAWFHAHSPLALGPSKRTRIVEKGRNIGLSMMCAMDRLMEISRWPNSTVAVAGAGGSTSDRFIDICHSLIKNATADAAWFDQREGLTSRVELGNGSGIIPLPGGNPDKVRSERIVGGVLDEVAFHLYPTRIMRSMRGAMLEGGTLDIISTHDGAGTHFYKLLEDTRTGSTGYTAFTFPLHDPHAWRQGVPLKKQVENGLRLIAPWVSLDALDEQRREDPAGYMQENLCEVLDASLNVFSRAEVEAAIDHTLPDWATRITEDDIWPGATPREVEAIETLIRQGITAPARPSHPAAMGDGDITGVGGGGVWEPTALGIDFASLKDLSSWKLWRATDDGPRQCWVEFLSGVPTPSQNALIRIVHDRVKPYVVAIDQTGPGTGLFEHARHDLRLDTKVVGIHFAQTVRMAGVGKTLPIKRVMANHLYRMISEGHARLLGSTRWVDLQRRHMLSVRRSDLDAPKSGGDGHGDGFWANAMVMWSLRMLSPPEPDDKDEDDEGGGIDLEALF